MNYHGGSREESKIDWRYILEAELTGFANGVEMGSRMREKEKSSTVLGLSVWVIGGW